MRVEIKIAPELAAALPRGTTIKAALCNRASVGEIFITLVPHQVPQLAPDTIASLDLYASWDETIHILDSGCQGFVNEGGAHE